ncbi:hypothetical protein V7787_52795, partial [Pseudomonas sp. CGJS7]
MDPGEVDFGKATFAGPTSSDGGVTGGTKLSNVAQGSVSATSTDGINGAQLYNVAGPSDATYIINNGRGARYVRTNDTGLPLEDAHAQAAGATAMGYNATSSASDAVAIGKNAKAGHANSVALGAGAATTAGAQTDYNAPYVGSSNSTGQVNVGGRTIGGVAAGIAADDAANVGQVQAGVNHAISESKSYTDSQIGAVAGAVHNNDNRITVVEGDVTNLEKGAAGMFQVSQDNTAAPSATGTNSAAGGAGAKATGNGSIALGNDSGAAGSGSTAVGSGAQAISENSVAIGKGSLANQDNTVSVGAAGQERKITNVAAGQSDTDAVNVAQLKGYQSGGVQYDKNPDGSVNHGSLTLNSNGHGPTTIHNVGAGVAPTDAVNVDQLNSGLSNTLNQANNYTEQRVQKVESDVWELRRE